MPLTRVIDLIGRNTHLDEFLPPLAASLRTVADLDVLAVAVPHDTWTTARLKCVRVGPPDGASAAAEVQSIPIAPLDQGRLAALAAAGSTAMVFDRLDGPVEYPDVIHALRGLGQQSACLLPLATALGPVGLMAFASSQEGTYRQCDSSFLRHVGALVAMAIDNDRHQQEARTRERQLQAERDHWRTLLEMTKAVVTERDVAALRAAIVPNVRRIVPHDHTNLYLIDEQRQLGPFVIDPTAPAWPDELATEIRLDREPYQSWLVPLDRAVDVDVTKADPTGWEALHAHVVASGVKRICNAPLVTPHRVLGVLSLGRLTPSPFTSDELGLVAQIAEQIALALENAVAFSEIASLKERIGSISGVPVDGIAVMRPSGLPLPLHTESGRNPLYRPAYRSEVLRRIYFKYIEHASPAVHGDIELTWQTVARLIELAYRCNLCRRCAQTCPLGVDNSVAAREIRKIASQEMGLHPRELHEDGSVLQQRVGSSTGMTPLVVKDNIEFIQEDTAEKTGLEVEIPWDVEGAEILLVHNAGEIMSWPENVGAFAVIFNAAGLSWTLSSEVGGYDGINYGVWYDDVQFARTAIMHAQAAKRLGVKKIVLGECGHAQKSLTVIADRVLTGDLNIPRESCMPLLRDIVKSGKIAFDKSRNDFPITLHDPCNMARLMGVISPQREVMAEIAPAHRFREMTPNGCNNYCCGGGSGFAIMSGNNFADWRHHATGRRKLRQVLEAFSDEPMDREHPKYVCAPCSNCKGQLRDIITYYDAFEKAGIYYGGLVELIVNAMVDVKPGFVDFEWH